MNTNSSRSTARALDQFYTDSKVAETCINFAKEQLQHREFSTMVEPSAGAGAFSKKLGVSCVALDIDPKCAGINQADFLTWQPPATTGACLVIGNPPFGQSSTLAVQFFNRAARFADAIAFIVPLTFKKHSIQSRLDRKFHLVASLAIPARSFVFEGEACSIPCEFQVWERRDNLRSIAKLRRSHPDFEFCSREEADFAVQRVGANAGRIKDVCNAGSANSHYFIKANISSDLLRAHFEAIDFNQVRLNTAAVPSIAKTELVALYSELAHAMPTIYTGAIPSQFLEEYGQLQLPKGTCVFEAFYRPVAGFVTKRAKRNNKAFRNFGIVPSDAI